MAILIGDIGGSSGQWALLQDADTIRIKTVGYNPISQSQETLERMLAELAEQLPGKLPEEIVYYGAGTAHPRVRHALEQALSQVWPAPRVSIHSDMLAAARAVCGSTDGVVCIVGTGSNVCHYNGREIDYQAPTLGYPLGDEGSGTDIGRRLVRAYYYGQMKDPVRASFATVLPPDRYDFLRMFKRSSAPNQFLASLVPLLVPHRSEDLMQEVLHAAFKDFIHYHLSIYQKDTTIHLVGSIAFYFCIEFEKELKKHGLQLGIVAKEPLEGLIRYHVGQQRESE